MTKKDYLMVAENIHETYRGVFRSDIQEVVDALKKEQAEMFVTVFAKENSRFDRDRFLIACGVSR